MKKLTKELDAILLERFGKDSIIALATKADHVPYVRNVDVIYDNGAFYVLTQGLSSKMKQNPTDLSIQSTFSHTEDVPGMAEYENAGFPT